MIRAQHYVARAIVLGLAAAIVAAPAVLPDGDIEDVQLQVTPAELAPTSSAN
ncbi:MAG: hypothetical protein PVI23_01015 [Maricaulaceae bacterium]|jgi:hypothetical protein